MNMKANMINLSVFFETGHWELFVNKFILFLIMEKKSSSSKLGQKTFLFQLSAVFLYPWSVSKKRRIFWSADWGKKKKTPRKWSELRVLHWALGNDCEIHLIKCNCPSSSSKTKKNDNDNNLQFELRHWRNLNESAERRCSASQAWAHSFLWLVKRWEKPHWSEPWPQCCLVHSAIILAALPPSLSLNPSLRLCLSLSLSLSLLPTCRSRDW